jgi:hypothetical protein
MVALWVREAVPKIFILPGFEDSEVLGTGPKELEDLCASKWKELLFP